MNKKEYKYLVKKEVCHQKKLLARLWGKYFNSSTNAVFLIRKMQYCNGKNTVFGKLKAKLLQRKLMRRYGMHIGMTCVLGEGLHIPHPTAIVIGGSVVAGKNLSIYQGSTIGGAHIGDAKAGRQPTLGDNVTIFANSSVLGDINIADNVTIGAHSLVLHDCPGGGYT